MRLRLGLAVAALALADGCTRRPPAPPDLVLVTVDTLRADHLGFMGYARDTAPHLGALARQGVSFSRCYAPSSTTGASHASLFSSLSPPHHGVLANRQRFPKLPTLMSVLRGRGYLTAGFVSSVVLGRKSGLQDHFEHFDDELSTPELNRPQRYERPAKATAAAALAYLKGRPAGRPFFLWIHLIDPHGPYQAPVDPNHFLNDALGAGGPVLPLGQSDWVRGQIPAYQVLEGRGDAAFYVARYDGEIRYADAALGELFAGLQELGSFERSLIAVTADHGETLMEPGHHRYFSHGTIAYEETVRVPLVIREPGGQKRLASVAREGVVTLLDVAPTVLALLGLPAPSGFEGRNLLETRAPGETSVFSLGAYGSDTLEKQIGTQFSLLRDPWRYVRNSQDGREELYDHRLDPQETRDLAAGQPPVLATLRREMDLFLAQGLAQAPPVEMTPEHLEALKALGYGR